MKMRRQSRRSVSVAADSYRLHDLFELVPERVDFGRSDLSTPVVRVRTDGVDSCVEEITSSAAIGRIDLIFGLMTQTRAA